MLFGKKNTKEKGDKGEEVATKFLEKEGFKIVDRNFATRYGEIDIICTKEKLLVFVEVKMKSKYGVGEPENMINMKKINQIHRMADVYLERNKRLAAKHPHHRVDVIALVMERGTDQVFRLNHYENVGAEF